VADRCRLESILHRNILIRINGGDRNEARRLIHEGLEIMTRLERQSALDAKAQNTLSKLKEIAPALGI